MITFYFANMAFAIVQVGIINWSSINQAGLLMTKAQIFMKAKKLSIISLIALFAITGCKETRKDSQNEKVIVTALSKENTENQVWEMEEKYWDYVQKTDTAAYKKLWHDDFIGYPSFGNGVSNKSKIAAWIPELHQDSNLTFSYKLYKKAVNAIDDVVIVFYDTDEMWTDKENKIVRKETYKFTHTWKKYNDNWVILGGMAAKKNQDILTD